MAAAEHRVINPPAAAGAAFDFDLGVGGAEPIDQRVERERLGMAGAIIGEKIAVMIPFQIGNAVRRQQLVQHAEKMCTHFGPGEIEHKLVPLRGSVKTGPVQAPIGMRAIEIAVGADHFGLDPQPEIHPQFADIVD